MRSAPSGTSATASASTCCRINVYYFYEVYRDEKALEAHRAAPHYAVWRAAADTLDGPPQATRCDTVFPAATDYWERKSARV
jgi:quinol monooxygenase YgiN